MKINPSNFPLIIITAFLAGVILALALGFRPGHGSNERRGPGRQPSAVIWCVDAWDSDLL